MALTVYILKNSEHTFLNCVTPCYLAVLSGVTQGVEKYALNLRDTHAIWFFS